MGPTCRDHLLPLASIEEREENEIGGFRTLKNRFFSPNERGEKGDENEAFNGVNRYLNREDLIPVP